MIRGMSRGLLAGCLLVLLQFVLLALLLVITVPVWAAGRMPWPAGALLLLGAAVGLWALWTNRPGNFNIHPAPRQGGRLVEHGPYRWIRHPMYTSLLCAAAGCVVAVPSVPAAATAAGLLGVLVGKSLLEERWLSEWHPDYRAYCRRTWRFLPGVF
jgi:protein-S-isoprenylcysteine O-methyltransferase Ste14